MIQFSNGKRTKLCNWSCQNLCLNKSTRNCGWQCHMPDTPEPLRIGIRLSKKKLSRHFKSRTVANILNFLNKSNFVADTILSTRNWGSHKRDIYFSYKLMVMRSLLLSNFYVLSIKKQKYYFRVFVVYVKDI